MQMKKNTNNKSLDWFVGFSEGDGCWNKQNRFDITQHTADIQILYKIKTHLGFGKVTTSKTRPNESRYTVTKLEHLSILENLFKDRICTQHTMLRFNKFFNNKYLIKNKPNLNTGWLSGFIDAEGCFRIKIEEQNSNKNIKLIFEISQKTLDSKIIYNIRDLLHLKKNVYEDKTVTRLYLSGKQSRQKLIKYLDSYTLKTEKRIVYLKWKKANEIKNRGLHLTKRGKDGKEQIEKLKNHLNKWRRSI